MVNHRASWELRPRDEEDDDEQFYNLYDNHPELFTIKVHYKGTFEHTSLREYKDGELRIIDQVNEDFFNLTDVDAIALGAGYKFKSYVLYFWRIPLTSLDNGLRPLQTDDDVNEFLYHASYFRFMELYMDGRPSKKTAKICLSIVAPTVVIKELDEEDNMDYGEVRMDDIAQEVAAKQEEEEEVIDLGFSTEDEEEEVEGEEEMEDDFEFINDPDEIMEDVVAEPHVDMGAPATPERNGNVVRDDADVTEGVARSAESSEALRKMKGKSTSIDNEESSVHNRIDEVVDDVEGEEHYLETQEGDMILDGFGEPVPRQHDEEYNYCVAEDHFDNTELEDEIVTERWDNEGSSVNIQEEVEG